MAKKEFEEVKAIQVKPGKPISKLLEEMAGTGFQGRKLGEIVEVWERMLYDDVTIFFGYAGSLSTTGQWKIVNWLIDKRFIDVLVSTGANISEDIVEAMGFSYYKGSYLVDDRELLKTDYNRYYDVFGSEKEYTRMIELIAEFILTLDEDKIYNTREFLYEFGKWLNKRGIRGIVAKAAEKKVPIYCPAIVDSAYGDAALIARSKGFNLKIDQVKDYDEFMSLADKIKSSGVIYVGGGVPKDFIQLLAVSSPLRYEDKKIPGREGKYRKELKEGYYPHKYAIQITTDSPQWGGLSGCTFEEAISWGKIDEKANFVQCYCDATIALPLVVHALSERVEERKNYTDFSWLFEG